MRLLSSQILFLSWSTSEAFSAYPQITTHRSILQNNVQQRSNNRHKLALFAELTPRQLQFWEDVEDGLQDVSKFYSSTEQQSIDRIFAFAKSAQGISDKPLPSMVGHNPSEEHVDGLTAKPFWDLSSDNELFPWAAELESKSHIVIDEFTAKLAKDAAQAADSSSTGNKAQMFAGDSSWQNAVMGTGWSAFRLQRLGIWNTKNCEEFPRTYDLLRSLDIPLAVRGVCFARQGPQSGVATHSDGRNFILTSHLGLKIPEGCWMKAGSETRTWEEGKLVTLDTSFDHSTGNPTDEERHVLIIDFWHPELSNAERAALEFVYDLRNKFESGQVPVRTPRSLQKENAGLAGFWSALTGAGAADDGEK